ncbi:MAG: ubiquinone biosynthesis regulatory protein kinase UbiB [Alteromonadaceae bacterium]|nr:ubiquinone biosynthesis regulatory protein kinase UbiB [Alteromonadaceae bacterium]
MASKRFYQITKVILQYGLDDLIPAHWIPWYARIGRHSIFWLRNRHKQRSRGERLRLALESLGPVFIKFGQMLSTRRDLIPLDIADELAILQDNVLPFDGQIALQSVLKELKLNSVDELFSEFSITPMASASIAQVHGAKLKACGTDVVVKVIRPNIAPIIESDVELLRAIAAVVQKWLPDGKRMRPVEVVEEYQKTIFDELDLVREATNGMHIKHNFKDSHSLYVPHFYTDYCTQNVIVMERIYGTPVADVDSLLEQGVNMKLLAERGVEVFFTQVFRDSFFHADMHPGNIFVGLDRPHDPYYIGIDYGIVGTLNAQDKHYLAANFIAFFNRDYRKVAELHVDSGWVPSDTNVDDLEVAIRAVCDPIFQKPLNEISFGHVLLQLFNTARRFNMQVQPQLVLLQKTLLYVEGLGRLLYPQLDLWATAKPFLENWMNEQIGFKAFFSKVQQNAPYWVEKFPTMPDLFFNTLQQLKGLPEREEKLFLKQRRQQREYQKSTLYGMLGSTSFVLALLLFINDKSWYYDASAVVVGVLFWLKAAVKTRFLDDD